MLSEYVLVVHAQASDTFQCMHLTPYWVAARCIDWILAWLQGYQQCQLPNNGRAGHDLA
jgi:hypothetical protein